MNVYTFILLSLSSILELNMEGDAVVLTFYMHVVRWIAKQSQVKVKVKVK